MYFKFERLTTWQVARSFTINIYQLSKKFPKEELFGLTNQIRRAAVSIQLNIAEGSERGSDKDQQRFLRMAKGSLNEVVSALYVAKDQGYISNQLFQSTYTESFKLAKKIQKFIHSISSSQ